MSPVSGIFMIIIGAILLISVFIVPGIRLVVIRIIGYTFFGIAVTIRFYILLPIGLLQAILYFFLGEILDLISADNTHAITQVTHTYLPKFFLLQLQRYNGLGDQVPGVSILLLRYATTITIYITVGIAYLWLKVEHGFNSILIEKGFILLAIGIAINILSSSLYHISAALSKKPNDVVKESEKVEESINPIMLYRLGQSKNSDSQIYKNSDIMNIYRNVAPTLAQIQRNDLGLKPFYIAYRHGNEDFFQFEDSFNIMSLMEVINELPVMDVTEGMIDYCIYYRNGKSFHKTDYMSRERLKILTKAVLSIYTRK